MARNTYAKTLTLPAHLRPRRDISQKILQGTFRCTAPRLAAAVATRAGSTCCTIATTPPCQRQRLPSHRARFAAGRHLAGSTRKVAGLCNATLQRKTWRLDAGCRLLVRMVQLPVPSTISQQRLRADLRCARAVLLAAPPPPLPAFSSFYRWTMVDLLAWFSSSVRQPSFSPFLWFSPPNTPPYALLPHHLFAPPLVLHSLRCSPTIPTFSAWA